MMNRSRYFVLVLITALLAGCTTNTSEKITVGSGKVVTESRNVGSFTRLELSCSADVTIAYGMQQEVTLEGEDNILPLIDTRLANGTLTIEAKPKANFTNKERLIVHIVVPILTSIHATSSGNVDMDAWTVDNLELSTSGSGNIHIASLDTPALVARLSGSGDITIGGGKGVNQTITAKASGNYDAGAMESQEVNAIASGSGNITVWVTRSLSASVSGSGGIRYYGSPTVEQSDTGSGSVVRLGDKP